MLKLKDQNYIAVYVSSEDNFYLPSLFGIYGSAGTNTKLATNKWAQYFQAFSLTETRWNRPDNPDYPCKETGQSQSTSVEACIDRFIESAVNCSSAYQSTPRSRRPCQTLEQYRAWNTWMDRITHLDEKHIHEVTGCLGPCNMTAYKLTRDGGLKSVPNSADGTVLLMRLSIAGRYETKEQYLVYTTDCFIADVGGYLGLLLGHSMYSLFCSGQDIGKTLFRRFFVKQ